MFEIKTGRPAAWHQAQLDLYVAAARQLFPEGLTSFDAVNETHRKWRAILPLWAK